MAGGELGEAVSRAKHDGWMVERIGVDVADLRGWKVGYIAGSSARSMLEAYAFHFVPPGAVWRVVIFRGIGEWNPEVHGPRQVWRIERRRHSVRAWRTK